MSDKHAEFDFWLGEWDLTWEGGKGTNAITRILDSKIVQENFRASEGSPLVGMSVSAYDEREGRWKQTWVDNHGGYLDFTGGIQDGKMILSRDGIDREGELVKQRMVWFDIEHDALMWHWEGSKDGGKTWDVLWAITYKRKK